MSEYQYYEFQAIDRPLTPQEQATLRKYSSRATITSGRFKVEYSWGDFKGNAAEWMGKYFDAFLYLANWGTHELMLRLPVFLPFLEALVSSRAAPTTLRRHFRNVWVLGGYIVRQVALEGRTRRAVARDVVVEEVDEDGGPWIADFMTEEEQTSFDSTCRKLSRFLRRRP